MQISFDAEGESSYNVDHINFACNCTEYIPDSGFCSKGFSSCAVGKGVFFQKGSAEQNQKMGEKI